MSPTEVTPAAGSDAHVIDFELPHPDEVFVAGEWRKPAEPGVIDVVDPTTEEVLIQVARPGAAEADAAVAAARAAFDHGPWPRMTPEERVEVVGRFTKAMEGTWAISIRPGLWSLAPRSPTPRSSTTARP